MIMYNPIAQAALLNAERTGFNIALGLRVGHEIRCSFAIPKHR